jgi:hypothetical protein
MRVEKGITYRRDVASWTIDQHGYPRFLLYVFSDASFSVRVRTYSPLVPFSGWPRRGFMYTVIISSPVGFNPRLPSRPIYERHQFVGNWNFGLDRFSTTSAIRTAK